MITGHKFMIEHVFICMRYICEKILLIYIKDPFMQYNMECVISALCMSGYMISFDFIVFNPYKKGI